MRRLSTAVCFVLLCCVLGLDDQTIALFVSLRVLLACGLLFFLRCEWRAGRECVATRVDDSATVKENYQLSQTVMNLSDQHKLLCDIRTSVLKSTKYSREALLELRFSVRDRSPASSRRGSVASSPKCTSELEEVYAVSPLMQSTDSAFRNRTGFSSSCGSLRLEAST
jgi:hypothetical protein